jgi:hypothetical protein
MRKYVLRGAGLLLVLGSLLGITPTTKADAQQCCACTLDCVFGKHCCARVVNGRCEQTCLASGLPCPVC